MTNSPNNFSDKLLKILMEKLDIKKEDLNLQANLGSDLSLGDVERADLIASLEKELNLTITDKSKLGNVQTLEDLIRLVEENSNEF